MKLFKHLNPVTAWRKWRAPPLAERDKENATGSPILGRKDWRAKTPKIAAVTLMAALALGGSVQLAHRHEQRILADRAAVVRLEEERENKIAEQLKKAGVESPHYWATELKKNATVRANIWGNLPTFTPQDIREFERLCKVANRAYGYGPAADEALEDAPSPDAIRRLLPMFAVVHKSVETAKDAKERDQVIGWERKDLAGAFHFLVHPLEQDLWMARPSYEAFGHVNDNLDRPEFRQLMYKLKEYADFEADPFPSDERYAQIREEIRKYNAQLPKGTAPSGFKPDPSALKLLE